LILKQKHSSQTAWFCIADTLAKYVSSYILVNTPIIANICCGNERVKKKKTNKKNANKVTPS
jgi:hypothetical protein